MADYAAPPVGSAPAVAARSARLPAGIMERNRTVQELFTRHHTTLVRVLTAKLRSESDAREVAQEAYLKLLELQRPDSVSCLRAYLFRIATNLATDHLRKQRVRENAARTQSYTMEDLLAAPQPDRILTGNEQLHIVRTAMLELPEKCRTACALHLFAEQPVREIAGRMRLSQRMVRYYVARGLSHCRHALDAQPGVIDAATDES